MVSKLDDFFSFPVTCNCSVEIVRKVVSVGDVLVAVNNHQMLNEEFSDIVTFLEMLRCV